MQGRPIDTTDIPDVETLDALHSSGRKWRDIAADLGISLTALDNYRKHRLSDDDPRFRRAAIERQDRAFVAALTRAIARGRERAPFGIVRCTTPDLPLRRMDACPGRSYGGSSASLCLEAADYA